jgi:hypothetical protein
MYTCYICDRNFDAVINYSKHITNNHKIKIKCYYDQYLKSTGEGSCQYCKGPTIFAGIKGYFLSCRACKSQKAKDLRKAQRETPEKQQAFVEKVSANQTAIWKKRKASGEDRAIHDKSGKSLLKLWANTDPEIRKQKFGWLNRLSLEEKEWWITNVMLLTGAHRWWKTATQEDKRCLVKKRTNTMLAVESELVKIAMSDSASYVHYCQAVWYTTNMSYHRFKSEIDPDGKRSADWHLDHKFSVRAGFINKVDPRIIGSRYNLHIISASENTAKGMRCSITLESLIEATNAKI